MNAHDTRLYYQLQRTAFVAKQVADRLLLDAAGVTTAQAAVLSIVAADGPIRQNELADRLGQREAAITQMAGRLIERGLLSRRRSVADRRAWQIELTPAGETSVELAGNAFEHVNATLDAAFTDGQEEFVQRLVTIREALAGEHTSHPQ